MSAQGLTNASVFLARMGKGALSHEPSIVYAFRGAEKVQRTTPLYSDSLARSLVERLLEEAGWDSAN